MKELGKEMKENTWLSRNELAEFRSQVKNGQRDQIYTKLKKNREDGQIGEEGQA